MKRTVTIDLPDSPEMRKALADSLEIYTDTAGRHLRGTVDERCAEKVDDLFHPVYEALDAEIKRDQNPPPTKPYTRVLAGCVHDPTRRTWFLGPDGNWYVEKDVVEVHPRALHPDDWDSLVEPIVTSRPGDVDYLDQALRLAQALGRAIAMDGRA